MVQIKFKESEFFNRSNYFSDDILMIEISVEEYLNYFKINNRIAVSVVFSSICNFNFSKQFLEGNIQWIMK